MTSVFKLTVSFCFSILFLTVFLFGNILSAEETSWVSQIKFTSQNKTPLYLSPDIESEIITYYKHLTKVVIIEEAKEETKLGWSLVVYPQKGYIKNEHLINYQKAEQRNLFSNKKVSLLSTWKPIEIENSREYLFVKETSALTSKNIDVIKEGQKYLTIYDNLNEKNVWLKIIYPVEGYVENTTLYNEPNYSILGVGGYYGFYNQPYEKNFENYRNPFGFFIEYTKTSWDIVIRAGYNNAQHNASEFILKNNDIYLNINYTFLRFFDERLGLYAFVGCNYWSSKFQYTKYPSLTEYFPEEKDNGIGYKLGTGLQYNISNFFISAEYLFWSSGVATFGELPEKGEFTNQYKLYPGSNQIGINLGYRFIFN